MAASLVLTPESREGTANWRSGQGSPFVGTADVRRLERPLGFTVFSYLVSLIIISIIFFLK